MSRRKNLTRALGSGYAALAVNIIYTLGSVPLALSYLSREEFGLWALVTQISGYIALIDFGMAASISRILIDHKDDKHSGTYGAVIKTGWLVLLVQGAIAAVGGGALAPLLSKILQIPTHMTSTFTILIAFQSLILGVSIATKMFVHLLTAHQRYDISNYSQVAGFAMSFIVLWLGFRLGFGIYSLLLTAAAGFLISTAISIAGCSVLRLYPEGTQWGKVELRLFKSLFKFGSECFLQNLGWQLIAASQVILITRRLGLESAAVWSICTKVFTLAQQFVGKIFDFSVAAFSEMVVRHETEKLRRRFRDVLMLTGSISVLLGVILATCNASFVHIWTHGRISWPPINDALMAGVLIVSSLSRCYGGLAWITKEVRFMRYIYFIEGLAFVSIAFFIAPSTGFAGILGTAIVCNILFSGSYGLARAGRFLHVSLAEVAVAWLLPILRFLAVSAPLAAIVWLMTKHLPTRMELTVNAVVVGAISASLFWMIGLQPGTRKELLEMLEPVMKRFRSKRTA